MVNDINGSLVFVLTSPARFQVSFPWPPDSARGGRQNQKVCWVAWDLPPPPKIVFRRS